MPKAQKRKTHRMKTTMRNYSNRGGLKTAGRKEGESRQAHAVEKRVNAAGGTVPVLSFAITKGPRKDCNALFQVRHSDYSHMPGATCCMLASASTCRAPLQFGQPQGKQHAHPTPPLLTGSGHRMIFLDREGGSTHRQ